MSKVSYSLKDLERLFVLNLNNAEQIFMVLQYAVDDGVKYFVEDDIVREEQRRGIQAW